MVKYGRVRTVDYACLLDYSRWLMRKGIIQEGRKLTRLVEAYQEKMIKEGVEQW